jgi:hypothetical protein
MESDTFLGYGKPRLAIEGGRLSVKNVPVPIRSYLVPWATESLNHLGSLRSVTAIRRVHRRVAPAPSDSGAESAAARRKQTAKLVYKVLEDLKRLNANRSSQLVLVYLPSLNYHPDVLEFWSAVLLEHTRALDIPFIDLVEAFKKLPDHEAEKLYLPDRHFNARGNEHVAKLIYDALARIDTIREILFAGVARP